MPPGPAAFPMRFDGEEGLFPSPPAAEDTGRGKSVMFSSILDTGTTNLFSFHAPPQWCPGLEQLGKTGVDGETSLTYCLGCDSCSQLPKLTLLDLAGADNTDAGFSALGNGWSCYLVLERVQMDQQQCRVVPSTKLWPHWTLGNIQSISGSDVTAIAKHYLSYVFVALSSTGQTTNMIVPELLESYDGYRKQQHHHHCVQCFYLGFSY